MKNPYGLDAKGRYTTVSDLAPSTQYGLACNLTCPECGRSLIAVRAPGKRFMSHLAHHADDTDCTGYGESASHALAKEILQKSAESHDMFALPPVFVSDAEPHIKLPSKTYRYSEPKMKAIDVRIENVWFEHDAAEKFIEGAKVPDAVMEFSYKGRRSAVAIEICNTHAKTIEDVQEYANEPKIRGVIEIDVSSCQPTPENAVIFRELLRRHILGYEKQSDTKYWLFNPKMREKLYSYELCVYVDLPEGMYADPYSVVSAFNKHVEDWCEENGCPEHYHILSSCPVLTKSIDNIVHDRFDGHAYQSMPGYMKGIIRSVWTEPSEAIRLAIAPAATPVTYGQYASLPEHNGFQERCAEDFRRIASNIAEKTRDDVRRQFVEGAGVFVVNDIVKTRTGKSVTDYLPKSACPRKRLCMSDESLSTPSDGRALCQCLPDCQFQMEHVSEKIGQGFELRWSRCAYPEATDDKGKPRPGFHSSLDNLRKTMSQARYADDFSEIEKRRRGTRQRRRR